MDFTTEQINAIDARGGTILVSAAAGSGKTAVLIERALRLLTGKRESGVYDEPISADRLLIVTFTKAAAAEMRERLRRAIDAQLEQNPDNTELKRQKLLLQKAHIETIDSFCLSCLREFFAVANVAPDFRVSDEAELDLLRSNALAELIAECYSAPDEDFYALLDFVGIEKSDADEDITLSGLVDSLEDFISSYPYPEEKLNELLEPFGKDALPQDTEWGKYILYHAKESLWYLQRRLSGCLEIARNSAAVSDKLLASLESYIPTLDMLLDCVEAGVWDELERRFLLAEFESVRIMGHEPELEMIRECRKVIKDTVSKKLAPMFAVTGEQFVSDTRKLRPVMSKLCEMVRLYRKKIAAAKAEKSLLYFSDMEHILADICTEYKDGEYYRTDVAIELSRRFDQILIDEYQDTNYIQDLIFRSIAREDGRKIGNGTNIFMVGDVKQSIYGFRKAVPQLFLGYLESFAPYNPENPQFPAAITLSKNFRSRKEVTEFVNFTFSQLMRAGLGGVEYDTPEQRLCCGMTTAPDAGGRETELHILDGSAAAGDDDASYLLEARYCARVIKEMIECGYEVTDNNSMRPCGFGDFCIMRRSVSSGHGDAFVSQLEALGVPVSIVLDKGFFDAPEIRMILSLLRAIDNPALDIPMLAALRSPIFGFDCNKLAELRTKGGGKSIYACLLTLAEQGDASAIMARELLSELRAQAAFLPSGALISAIYRKTGLLSAVAAMPLGSARKKNLLALLEKAAAFEANGYKGLSRFINMIDTIIAQGKDYAPANLAGDDKVKIRTMHAVKGLQFPICIIAGLGSMMNNNSIRSRLLMHSEYASRAAKILTPASSGLGLGASVRDAERRVRYNTLHKFALTCAINDSAIDEELRLLYVAMTRPVDKLILVSTGKRGENLDNRIKGAASMIGTDNFVDGYTLGVNRYPGQWLIACAMLHPDSHELRERAGADLLSPAWCKVGLNTYIIPAESEMLQPIEAAQAQEIPAAECSDEEIAMLKERLNYRYPYAELNALPAKVTASSIHSKGANVAQTRPSFASDTGLSPTERGTALHRFMQFCDFSLAANNPDTELERLVNGGFLRRQEGVAVDLDRVRAFFGGEAGKLIAGCTNYHREWRFTAELEPHLLPLFTDLDTQGEQVILEGECDILLEYENEAIVLDYKTDIVGSGDILVERYSNQLRLYASAVEQILGKQTRRCYIYSFHLNELIPIVL